jgi:hypothetical protein
VIKNAKTKSELAVSNLHTFLESVRDSPAKYVREAELMHALARQDRLGTYRNEKHNVTPTSRSTIQRVCDKLLPGGKDAFDELRREALAELKTVARGLAEEPAPQRRTRDYFKAQRDERADEVQKGLMDCWHLTSAVYSAIKAGRQLVADGASPAASEKWRKQEATIRSKLRLVKQLVVTKGSDEEQWAESIRRL